MSAEAPATVAARVLEESYGVRPDVVAIAPGRVNLIGEHTDYNDGFVLPMALPFHTAVAAARRDDGVANLTSDVYGRGRFAIDADPTTSAGWVRYVHGMSSMMAEQHPGGGRPGWTGAIASTVPDGAGLSSSAALEVATAYAYAALTDRAIDGPSFARLARRVENEVLGVPSGIMDQLTAVVARDGHAALIDCADLSVRHIEVPDDVAVVVIDTGTRRELVGSHFRERQVSCELAAQRLGAGSLRCVAPDDLRHASLDPATLRRARHVVEENERTLAMADVLPRADLDAAGQLMAASHRSLRDLFEVSAPALDHAVARAERAPGCFGARMTGGGFAGCVVALVDAGAADPFVREAATWTWSGKPMRAWAIRPASGASVSVFSA